MSGYVYGPGGARTALNITATTTIKTMAGMIFKVMVVTVPTAAGGVYDSASTSGLGASNLVDIIGTGLAAGAILDFDGWPCANGITINPGTGGVVSISYT